MKGLPFMSKQLKITTPGIQKVLKNYTYVKSIVEYIWNGFDAGADTIWIELLNNELDGLESVIIKDNGVGIHKDLLHEKFQPFFESTKSTKNKYTSSIHGKKGIGRLTFFTFASNASWKTTYFDDESGTYKTYDILINSSTLNEYEEYELDTYFDTTGTIVTFSGLTKITSNEELLEHIKKEFCWYLTLNSHKNYAIHFNGEKIDISSLVHSCDEQIITEPNSNVTFNIKFVIWTHPLLGNESSSCYYLKSNGNECFKESSTLIEKGGNSHIVSIFQVNYLITLLLQIHLILNS